MACYDVYPNPDGEGWLLDVQSDLLTKTKTRVVIPLLPGETVPPPLKRLHPVFDIGGRRVVLATHLLAAVPGSMLRERTANLAARRDEITGALDMLFQGF